MTSHVIFMFCRTSLTDCPSYMEEKVQCLHLRMLWSLMLIQIKWISYQIFILCSTFDENCSLQKKLKVAMQADCPLYLCFEQKRHVSVHSHGRSIAICCCIPSAASPPPSSVAIQPYFKKMRRWVKLRLETSFSSVCLFCVIHFMTRACHASALIYLYLVLLSLCGYHIYWTARLLNLVLKYLRLS